MITLERPQEQGQGTYPTDPGDTTSSRQTRAGQGKTCSNPNRAHHMTPTTPINRTRVATTIGEESTKGDKEDTRGGGGERQSSRKARGGK